MFVHGVVGVYRNLRRERGLFDGSKGSMYVHEAMTLVKKWKDLNDANMTPDESVFF